jgi:hypothetical protein
LGACATLRSEPLPSVGAPEYAHVVAERLLDLRAGESRAERAAWAVLSLDPIILTGAVLGVEDEFGRTQLSEYDLVLVNGGTATVRRRYVVRLGRCVMMRRPTGPGYVIIVAQDETSCAAMNRAN